MGAINGRAPTSYKAFELRRHALGICTKCRNPKADSTNKNLCTPCSKKQSARARRRRAERKALGLCSTCGERPPSEGKMRCAECNDRNREYAKKYQEYSIAEGICIACKKEALPHTRDRATPFCLEHYLRNVAKGALGAGRLWEALLDKLEEQGWKCAYTGERLELGLNASADHIYPRSRFPERANDPDNIEWTSTTVNFAKRDLTRDEFLALVHTIASRNEQPM